MENINFDNAETSHVTTKTIAGANCDCNYTSTGCTKKCPEIMSLNSGELIEWMRNRKKQLGLTNAKLAEMSNVPEGTIDRILSQRYSEFRYSSIQPIMAVLIGLQTQTPEPNSDDEEQNQFYYDTIEGYKLALENKNHEIHELRNVIMQLDREINFLKNAYNDRSRMLEDVLIHRKWMESIIDDLRAEIKKQGGNA